MAKVLLLVFSALSFVTSVARADALAEIDGMMDMHSLKSTNTEAFSQSLYSAGFYLGSGKKGRMYFGVLYLMGAVSDKQESGTNTFSNQDIMLSFKWFMDKRGVFSFTGAYGVTAKATYKAGTEDAEKWSGTSMLGKFTVAPELSDTLSLGFSLTYYMGSFSEKRVETVASTVSNSRGYTGPSLTLYYRW